MKKVLQFYLWHEPVSDDDGRILFREALRLSHSLEQDDFLGSNPSFGYEVERRRFLLDAMTSGNSKWLANFA
jgi:hypothetical protein